MNFSQILEVWNYVVHCKKERYDIYIGRPSKYGNPYSHKEGTLAKYKVENRAEAIKRYEEDLRNDPEKMEMVKRELKGKILGCHCKPKFCHGHVLAWIANKE